MVGSPVRKFIGNTYGACTQELINIVPKAINIPTNTKIFSFLPKNITTFYK